MVLALGTQSGRTLGFTSNRDPVPLLVCASCLGCLHLPVDVGGAGLVFIPSGTVFPRGARFVNVVNEFMKGLSPLNGLCAAAADCLLPSSEQG